MLTKCMLNPLKLARLMEWNGRLGKPSAIMAIDICNHHIGIALAYHRQHSLPSSQEASQDQTDSNESGSESSNTAITTSLTALPPIPYMSSDPYHPSYAFLHHHRPEEANMIRTLDRVERTMEVADQLAQLAIDRQVKGVLVRWPGDLASTVSSGKPNMESAREVEEGQLLFPMDANRGNNAAGGGNAKSDGSMGYMRGRILYVLDACCTSHGHNQKNVHSEPLLMEGSRPFALYDTSQTEQQWIAYQQQNNKHSNSKPGVHPRIPKRCDKYGNSMAEMDLWGRAAIFGNQPPQPQQGKFYYSSKQQYSGYRVSNQFGMESSNDVDGNGERNQQQMRNENFDSLHDNESRVNSQFQRSLSAMHALYDFAKENLEGRIVLPLWASTEASASNRAMRERDHEGGLFEAKHNEESDLGYRARSNMLDAAPASSTPKKSEAADASKGNNRIKLRAVPASSAIPNNKPNGLASLVQMPKRKARRRGKGGS